MEQKKKNNIKKYRRPISLNIGIVVFVVIAIYLIISVVSFFMKDRISVVEVQKGRIVDDQSFTGIIIRDEELYYTESSGYISYFINNGDKVAKNGDVYMMSSGKITLNTSESQGEQADINYKEIKNIISVYASNYSDSSYSDVYNFRYEMQNKITEAVSQQTIALSQLASASGSYSTITSPRSGLVSYTYDGMEKLTAEDITADMFNPTDYEKKQLTSNEQVTANAPAYKLTQGEDWSIMIKLTQQQADQLSNSSYVTLKFMKDEITTTASIEIIHKDDAVFGKLNLNKYLVRYLSERYIDIQLINSTSEGLKIPTTAIIEKDFYSIPVEYLISDEQSTETGFNRTYYDDKGELKTELVKTIIYHRDDLFCYVDVNDFDFGDTVSLLNSSEEPYRIGATAQLKGVYNINQGYALFRLVQVLYQDDEYCIVRMNTPYGLALYDYIVLNGSSVTENQLIY